MRTTAKKFALILLLKAIFLIQSNFYKKIIFKGRTKVKSTSYSTRETALVNKNLRPLL